MSLEDLDFQSDESEYEVELNSGAAENRDDESSYLELVLLHDKLKWFEHIYYNNAVMDMQSAEAEEDEDEDDDWPSFDFARLRSELDAIRDYVDSIVEDLFSANSSESSSVISHEDGPGSDADDSAVSSVQDLFQLCEEAVSTSSSSLSADSDDTE